MPEPKTILVVDEELKVRLQLKRSLEEVGYQVLLAEAREAAKQTLQETGLDAVIVSWTLPELSGQDLVQWIQEQPQHIGKPVAIIALGNISPVIDSSNCYPVDVFVPRPCHPQELIRWLKELLP